MCARTRNRPAAGRDPGLGGVTQARPRPRPDHPRPLRLGPGRRGSAGSGDLDDLCLLVAGTVMTGERPRLLHPAEQLDPVERLWYVLLGSGESVQWQVEAEIAERYYARVAKEPTTWPFKAEDTVYVPQNHVQQYVNTGDEPLRLVVA